MEFFIKKNANLPILKMQVVKDGRAGFQELMESLPVSSIYFSMKDTSTGIPKIVDAPCGIVSLDLPAGSTPEYYIYFQFTERDTKTVGRYIGEFLIKNDEGNLILPLREEIYINVQDSFSSTEPCC
jgi:hypothetical protein